jgi:hypothetical protein
MGKREADVCCIEKLDRMEQDFIEPLNWHLL